MEKEFKINDILNAVDSISRTERKKELFFVSKKSPIKKNNVLRLYDEIKSNKNDVLILDKMFK
jgi:hypothetical protein